MFLIGAFLLGICAFVVFTAIVEYRIGSPIETGKPPADEKSDHPLTITAAGTGAALAAAKQNLLAGKRSEAVPMIDGAIRTTEVGRYAAPTGQKQYFETANEKIKAARHALQNGSPQAAAADLDAAKSAMDAAAKEVGEGSKTEYPPPGKWKKYAGARLINAQGSRIGELSAIDTPQAGSVPMARLSLGSRDVMGFLDVDDQSLEIPVDRLLFGKIRTIGSTMVLMPTLLSNADTIQHQQRSQR